MFKKRVSRTLRRGVKKRKLKNWKEKALHGEFVQQISGVAGEETWSWLRNRFLKKETEGMILAAHQDQALRTNSIKFSIDKTSETPLCSLCGESAETVRHIVSGRKKLAQREYRKRHDKVAMRVRWEMCRKYGIENTDNWYDHQPLSVTENGEVRDMTIYTDKVLKHNRPDITVGHKDSQEWTLIEIALPADQSIIRTEEEKVETSQELAFKIRRIYGASKVTVIPIMIGALGSIWKCAKTWYGRLGVPDFLGSVQLSVILGTAHVLRKVMCL